MTDQLIKVKVKKAGLEAFEDFLKASASGSYTFVDAVSWLTYVFADESDAVGFSLRFEDCIYDQVAEDAAWAARMAQNQYAQQAVSNQLVYSNPNQYAAGWGGQQQQLGSGGGGVNNQYSPYGMGMQIDSSQGPNLNSQNYRGY